MTTDRLGTSPTPDLAEVFEAAMARLANSLHVCLPGKIEKYDAATQMADVKPLLKVPVVYEDGDEGLDTLPVIPSVPVVFPRGGKCFITFPLAKGDNVLLVFADRAIDPYVDSSGSADLDPLDLRNHDLTDAVCIPGWYTKPKALKDTIDKDMVLGQEQGYQLHFTRSGVEITARGASTAADFVALAQKVMDELNKIKTAFNAHTHTGVTTGPGSTGNPSTAYIPATVASKNLKAD